MARREKAIFEVTAEDRASRVIRQVRDEFGGLDNAASRISFPSFGTLAKGAGVAAVGIAAVATATAGLVRSLAPYNRAINEARSLTGESAEAFGDLRGQVLGLSADLGADPVKQAEALYETLSAGVPRDNAISFLSTSTKAAVAGLTETKVAVDGITTVINAYSLQASEAERVADAYFATIEKGKTNFEELASSINLAIKPAASLGVEFEEVLAITAQLTAGGTPTSAAFTQIRSALTALQNPSADMIKLLQKQGFESGRAAIEAQGLAGTLQRLKEEAADDQELVKALGRVEALGAVLGVSGDQAVGFADKYERVMNSAGAASAAFAINSDNLDNSLQRVTSAFLIASDALDKYLGSLAGADSLSAIAIDSFGSIANAIQDQLDPLRNLDLNEEFVFLEEQIEQLSDILDNSLNLDIAGAEELVKERAAMQERLALVRERAGIASEEQAAIARANDFLRKLKEEREELIVGFNNLGAEDAFGRGGDFQIAVSNKDSAIAEKERELRALQGITEEQFKASQASAAAAEATKGQAEAQSQLNSLLSEFVTASKTKDDLAQEELRTQEQKFRVLLEEGSITKEQFANFSALQREKLGLLDEEASKREELIKQQTRQAEREAARLKSDNERLAEGFLSRAQTDQERLIEDLAEVSRLQSEGFLTGAQGAILDQRFRAEFARTQEDVTDGFDEMASAAESFRERIKTPLERLQDDIREVQALTAQGLFSEGESARVVSRLVEQFKGGAAEIQSAWADTMGVLRSNFSSFLRGGTDDFGEFVANIILEAAALQAENLLFGDKGFFAGLFGDGQEQAKALTIDVIPQVDRAPFEQVLEGFQQPLALPVTYDPSGIAADPFAGVELPTATIPVDLDFERGISQIYELVERGLPEEHVQQLHGVLDTGDMAMFEELRRKAEDNLEYFDGLGQTAGVNFGEAFSVANAPPISKGLEDAAAKAKDILSGIRVDVEPREPTKEISPLTLPIEPGFDPSALGLLGGQIEDEVGQIGNRAAGAFTKSFVPTPEVASIQVFQLMEDAGTAAADRTASSFEDANKSILGGLADMAKSAVSMLGNLAKRALSFVGDIFGGGGGGGINLSGLFSSLFSFDGGGFTGFGPRTGGTDGFGGFPAILHPGEQVVDLSRGQVASGGGVQIAQTLNIQPGVSQEMIPQIMKAAKDGTLAAIRDQGRRGGNRGRALGF